MGLLSWAKGKMMARTAAIEAAALNAGKLPKESADLIKNMAALIQVHEEIRDFDGRSLMPLDVRLQWLMEKPLSPLVEAADMGRVPWTPLEVWSMLFTAVLASGRYDEPALAKTIARLEDRAAERRRS